jgi:hypothetical protein
MKTIEECKIKLEADISRHVSHGWRVQTRTETTCQLVKDKKPNGCLIIILLLLFIIPGIVYMFMFKGTASLYIDVNNNGEIKYITDGLSAFEKTELTWD